MIAAAIAPIMAMVGGGVDMGRSYLTQARLQQACDAGVLAARKRLGAEAAATGVIPADAGDVGKRFFNINFRDGAYGSSARSFQMKLENDYAVSGVARATLPTAIMRIFGFNEIPLKVECEAQINFNNTDVMMVLDVTGSMNEMNAGDSKSRLETLKDTVKGFYAQLSAATTAGTRIRYGFVPYSTNVNVGGLLADDWVAKQWTYQSRTLRKESVTTIDVVYYSASSPVSGSRATVDVSNYAAPFTELDGYHCPSTPPNNVKASHVLKSTKAEAFIGPPSGTKVTQVWERTRNGDVYAVRLEDSTCIVSKTSYSNYIDTYNKVTQPGFGSAVEWRYEPVTIDTSEWRAETPGCIEERATHQIKDYANVDLSKARDLDIDAVPVAGDTDTQWRPMYSGLIYGRALEWSGAGKFEQKSIDTAKEFITPSGLKTDACPAPAMNMRELTSDALDAYLASLVANGSTYHDIGMIWGGRLLSPTGLFADANKDVSKNNPTNRNLIFLTDGITAPLDLSYSSYGFEPVDQRRWKPDWKVDGETMSLSKVVEDRFAFTCKEVKKRNITVWIVGFGTSLSDVMKNCAGEGHYFEAEDAVELNATFAQIAKNLSQLRIQR